VEHRKCLSVTSAHKVTKQPYFFKQYISCNNGIWLQEYIIPCVNRFMCNGYGCILNVTPCTLDSLLFYYHTRLKPKYCSNVLNTITCQWIHISYSITRLGPNQSNLSKHKPMPKSNFTYGTYAQMSTENF
jgi:hypothetical protein